MPRSLLLCLSLALGLTVTSTWDFGLCQPAAAGEKVLFVSDRDQPMNYDLYVLDVDTGAIRRLTTDPGIDNHPDLSPDGTRVIWSSTRKKERPSDPAETNPEGDFEIFVANWSETDYLDAPGGTVHQLTSNDITDTHIPPGMRHMPDRHPHFSPDGTRIIYTAKYVCVRTIEITYVSECSIPRAIETVDDCGRICEGIRIMDAQDLDGDHVGDNLIEIDHNALTAANPLVWPLRPSDDARWVGHPSFSHDGTKILFSGAVDGQGRNWEVYIADWDGSAVTSLRKVTEGSVYPPNANPIKMTGGAHFSMDDAEVLFTSTRTPQGNSQLFDLPASSERVPVGPGNRHPAASDAANDYVPEALAGGRIVVTSDRDVYRGIQTCGGGPPEYHAFVSSGASHVIDIQATHLKTPASGGFDIHLDGYQLDGVPAEEGQGTTFYGSWNQRTSPNASGGYYEASSGLSGEHVSIAVPPGTGEVDLRLGATSSSGIVRITIDGIAITDGNALVPGDPGMSGWDLFQPGFVTSNDLDLVIVSPDGSQQTNLTDNDFADEMNLIGDEVSWFCGLSPNLSMCTYLPKYFTAGQLCTMFNSASVLPANYPSRGLYPHAMSALNQFMSATNPLRPMNHNYWQYVQSLACNPASAQFLVVLPTPVNYHVDNTAPTAPQNPSPADHGALVLGSVHSVPLQWDPSSDPDGDPITYDVYFGPEGTERLLLANDNFASQALAESLGVGSYLWQVIAKDSRGGMMDGPVWRFLVVATDAVDGQSNPAQTGLRIVRNVPNPFRPNTTVSFDIPGSPGSSVKAVLRIYGPGGELVRTLLDTQLRPGPHKVIWDGRDENGREVRSGVYFCRIAAGGLAQARRLVLTR